jgi:hypothetical protein
MSRLHRLGPVSSLTDATFALPNDKLGLASGRSPGARTVLSRWHQNSAPPLILLTENPNGLSSHFGSFHDPT